MIRPGLCSITFRKLPPREIIAACVESGLQAIEWGGDIHCPHGDTAVAASLYQACNDAGIATPSYGSYFRMDPVCAEPDFRRVLDSAHALGAKTIRVWAGARASVDMDPSYRSRLVDEVRRVASLAESAGCAIGLEYHRHTATDTNAGALRMLEDADHPAVRIYWQPREVTPVDERLEGLQNILPHLCHLHVFQWIGTPIERRPLLEAEAEWRLYAGVAATAGASDIFAHLEFVRDDSLESLREDAQALHRILDSVK